MKKRTHNIQRWTKEDAEFYSNFFLDFFEDENLASAKASKVKHVSHSIQKQTHLSLKKKKL